MEEIVNQPLPENANGYDCKEAVIDGVTYQAYQPAEEGRKPSLCVYRKEAGGAVKFVDDAAEFQRVIDVVVFGVGPAIAEEAGA